MNATEQLSSKLKLLREVHNYTQEYVAGVLDISQNTYSLIEKGESKITIDRLDKLAHLYKMDVTDLIRFNEHTYIHTITHSQGVCSQNVTINHPLSDEERKMFQSTIERLERENEKLHKLIEKITEKL
ncbi:helix-turn-helix transcriptional regulator [Chitinophagaceae bacterium LWZ2-11]